MSRRSLILSGLAHLLVIIVLVFGLPRWISRHDMQEQISVVQILPIKEITNIKPSHPKPKVSKTPDKQKASEQKKEQVKTSQPTKAAKPEPKIEKKQDPQPMPKLTNKPIIKEKPKPTPVAKATKVEEKKQPDKKQAPQQQEVKKDNDKKATNKQHDDFDTVLKAVQKMDDQKADKAKQKVENNKDDFNDVESLIANNAKDEDYKPGLPMSISEKDAIKQQIMQNWDVLPGAKDAKDMVVTLRIALAPDGAVTNVIIVNKIRYGSDNSYRASVDSAIRAVYKSSPLKNLPPEKYDVLDGWRNLELNFDPREMY